MDNNSFICDTFLQPLPQSGRGFFLLCSDYSNKLLKSYNMRASSLAHLNVPTIDIIKEMGNEKKTNEDNYLEYLSFAKEKKLSVLDLKNLKLLFLKNLFLLVFCI